MMRHRFSPVRRAVRRLFEHDRGQGGGGGGGQGVTGALAVTETGADTAAFAGAVKVKGAFSATESGSDTAAFVGGDGFLTINGTGFLLNGNAWTPYGLSDGHFELTHVGDEAADAAMGATFLRSIVRKYGTYGTGYQQDMQEEGQPGDLKPAYLSALVSRLMASRAAGMRNGIAMDSNKGQGVEASGGNDFFGGLTEGNRQKGLFIGTAVYLAENHGDLIDWMEPIVEPNSAVVASKEVLWAFQEESMTAVLAVAPHMLFAIGPRDYASGNIANCINPAWLIPGNPFYGHVFMTCNFLDNLAMDAAQRVTRAASVASTRNTQGVPAWINQLATHFSNDPDNTNLDATMALHDAATGGAIGYNYWERVSMAGTADGLEYLSDIADPESARLSHDARIAVVTAHFSGFPYWMTAPVISGDPTVGELVAYTSGTAAGRPAPTLTARVRVDGVDKGDAASYLIQAGDVGKAVVIRQTATNTAGAPTSDSAAVTAVDVGGDTLLSTGRIGGQVASLIDFSADALTQDLMKRARNIAKPVGNPYQYSEASTLLRVASLTRTSNVTTVVLSQAPADYYSEGGDIRTGYRLVLTCLADSSFDADHAVITVTNQTHFTYPNVGANASYTAVNIYDVAATSINSVAVGAAGHPIEDFYTILSTVSGSTPTHDDLNGTYPFVFPGGIPTGLAAEGATLSNWTSGGGDSTFTLTVDASDTTFTTLNFSGVPTDGTFRMPRGIRSDHDQTGATYLRPDAAQFLSRFGFLRFMDAGRTNLNAFIKSWEKRPVIACGLGMPLADMVAMCNELGCNMWYCFPQWATDDYITQAATYIRDSLTGGKWCIFERSNENWNEGTFPHLWWDLTQARKTLKAHFHGFNAGGVSESVITSVAKVAGVVTVTLNRAPPFANGATAVFTITNGSTTGYNTPTTGAVMTVSGNTFTFSGNSGSGTATVTDATIIGEPTDELYDWDKITSPREIAWRVHGWRTYQMSQLVSAVFSGLNGRARVVLMGFEENFVPFGVQEDKVFPWLEAQYGDMSDWCYGIGGAPYPQVTGTTLSQLQTSLASEMTNLNTRADRVTALCATYGLHHVQYEANISFAAIAGNTTLIDSTHTNSIGRAMQRSMIDNPLGHGVEYQAIYFTSMQFTGVGGGSHWGIARTLAADGGAIGSATDERLKGIDDALLDAPP